MVEIGVLAEDERVELIDGEIVEMTPEGSRHAACVDRLTALFSRLLAPRGIVRVQSSVVVSDLSQPQPDVTLLVQRDDYYDGAHPWPGDVLLLVEVGLSSGSTRQYDGMPHWAQTTGLVTRSLVREPGETISTASSTSAGSRVPEVFESTSSFPATDVGNEHGVVWHMDPHRSAHCAV